MRIRKIVLIVLTLILLIVNGTGAKTIVKPDVIYKYTMHGPTFYYPFIMECDHRLYINYTVFGGLMVAVPNELIGSIGSTSVYSACGYNIKDSICNNNSLGKDGQFCSRYDYLCDDSFKINHIKYHLKGNGIYNVLSLSGNKSNAVQKVDEDDYNFWWVYLIDAKPDSQMKGLRKIGTVGSGTVYAFKGVDPSQFVVLNFKNNWMFVQKAKGYKGKKIENILKEVVF